MSGPVYHRAPGALFSEVGADFVALHVERGQCYGMEQVSAAIWRLLAEPCDLASICEGLVKQFDVDPGRCRAEVELFLLTLCSEGLIEKTANRNVAR